MGDVPASEFVRPEEGIWKLWPEAEDDCVDSMDGNGSTPRSSGGGGVRACCSGDAL